jgi:hypothetical protein
MDRLRKEKERPEKSKKKAQRLKEWITKPALCPRLFFVFNWALILTKSPVPKARLNDIQTSPSL